MEDRSPKARVPWATEQTLASQSVAQGPEASIPLEAPWTVEAPATPQIAEPESAFQWDA